VPADSYSSNSLRISAYSVPAFVYSEVSQGRILYFNLLARCIAFARTIVYNKGVNGYVRPKGVFDMAKSANLYARIEPELKEQAESILAALGIPASNAITMFYKQIVLQNGLPFEVKLPEHPLDVSRMTAAQLDAELEKGYTDAKAGRTIPAEQVFANVRKEFGV
jgi:DNA-damage-inducible protein J